MRSAEAQRASLRGDSGGLQVLNPSDQGSSDDQDTAGSAFRLTELVSRVFETGLAAFPGSGVRRDGLRRPAHDLPSAANCRRAGRGSLVQRSPCAVAAALVELESVADSGRPGGRSLSAARHDPDLRGRHAHAASGKDGLWQSTRGRCARTILRAGPCLFGLYTQVALWFSELTESERRAGCRLSPGRAAPSRG